MYALLNKNISTEQAAPTQSCPRVLYSLHWGVKTVFSLSVPKNKRNLDVLWRQDLLVPFGTEKLFTFDFYLYVKFKEH